MKELYPGHYIKNLLTTARYGCLVVVFLLCFFFSYSQELVPELVFMNAQLKTGPGTQPAGADGAVYVFQNVTTGIDAVITINGRSSNNVSLSSIDLLGPDQDPVNGTGYDNAWQPRVAYNSGNAPANMNWWMEFQVSFVQHNDYSPSLVNAFYVTALDVDGDGQNLHEYLSFYKQLNYTLEQNTDIQPCSITGCISDASSAGKEFDGPTKNYKNITPTATDVMVTNYYTNANSFIIRIGAKTGTTGSSVADRMNSLWFKTFTYNVPVVHELPVSLVAFTAQLQNNNVLLNWTTAMETNTSHFTIERSMDGVSFDDAAIVFTDENGSIKKNYSFTDNISKINTRLIYYRLKMVDLDAKYSYSKIVLVRLGDDQGQTAMLIYPNPVMNELRITIPSEWQNKTVAYNVYNTNGILVRQKINGSAGQTEIFHVADLPAGIYIIKTATGDKTSVQKFIKANS